MLRDNIVFDFLGGGQRGAQWVVGVANIKANYYHKEFPRFDEYLIDQLQIYSVLHFYGNGIILFEFVYGNDGTSTLRNFRIIAVEDNRAIVWQSGFQILSE